MNENYQRLIESRFKIVNKEGQKVPFILNPIQAKYLTQDSSGRDIILKARQQGFSSLILARFTADFLLKENSESVVVADEQDNAVSLLDRVKYFIWSYEEITGKKVPLRYNSKYEMVNSVTNSKYQIGTAEDVDFGRSRTLTNLHLSEAAFYPHFQKILAGALQAVVPTGLVAIETTANGFNEFRDFYFSSKAGETGFKANFYKASDFYSPEFLEQRKKELKGLYLQEYPETDVEAFLTSGSLFFDGSALKSYLDQAKEPITEGLIYV